MILTNYLLGFNTGVYHVFEFDTGNNYIPRHLFKHSRHELNREYILWKSGENDYDKKQQLILNE